MEDCDVDSAVVAGQLKNAGSLRCVATAEEIEFLKKLKFTQKA